jgi:hypothetical protein
MLVAIANKPCWKPMQHMHAVLGPALQLSLFFPHCWIYCQSMAGQSLFIAKLEFFQTDAACL